MEEQPIIIKRKKVVAGGHHGGSWKVAFADFATAMMAFFLVLWLTATASPEQKKRLRVTSGIPLASPRVVLQTLWILRAVPRSSMRRVRISNRARSRLKTKWWMSSLKLLNSDVCRSCFRS
ncbi:flagellar motor protein MotB [Marinobacter adhaerens]|uniref:flagellar motor protein MotB n=1 Tax=Marinobacter adhaerens TaxID=1033846 RepID=UPI003873AE63